MEIEIYKNYTCKHSENLGKIMREQEQLRINNLCSYIPQMIWTTSWNGSCESPITIDIAAKSGKWF